MAHSCCGLHTTKSRIFLSNQTKGSSHTSPLRTSAKDASLEPNETGKYPNADTDDTAMQLTGAGRCWLFFTGDTEASRTVIHHHHDATA
jgi:hypothetical protein